jgi:hypothetical protein
MSVVPLNACIEIATGRLFDVTGTHSRWGEINCDDGSVAARTSCTSRTIDVGDDVQKMWEKNFD